MIWRNITNTIIGLKMYMIENFGCIRYKLWNSKRRKRRMTIKWRFETHDVLITPIFKNSNSFRKCFLSAKYVVFIWQVTKWEKPLNTKRVFSVLLCNVIKKLFVLRFGVLKGLDSYSYRITTSYMYTTFSSKQRAVELKICN